MATITEDYVSFEVAKLLKEKGFDEQTRFAYTESGKADFSSLTRYWNQGSLYACPSQAMAMKWLREVHNLYIQTAVTSWPQKGYSVHIYMYNDCYNNFEEVPFVEHKESYEEACEAACIYALKNLI